MSLEHRKHNSVIFWLGEIEEKRRSEKDVYQAKCEAKMPVSDTIRDMKYLRLQRERPKSNQSIDEKCVRNGNEFF